MAKIGFIFLLYVMPTILFAQVSIGIRFAPSISYNRVNLTSDSLRNFDPTSSAVASVGIFSEMSFAERYAFLLSVNYTPRHLRYSYERLHPGATQFIEQEEFKKIQYLNLGVGLKLYTQDVFPSSRLFLSIESLIDINLHSEYDENTLEVIESSLVKEDALLNASLRIEPGVEMSLGLGTSLFVALSYTRSLANLIGKPQNLPKSTELSIKNQSIALVLGITF